MKYNFFLIHLSNVLKILFVILGSVGATNMNERSSRSHAIFTITVECSEKGPDGQNHVRMGKLHLVDLAVSLLHGVSSNWTYLYSNLLYVSRKFWKAAIMFLPLKHRKHIKSV